MNKRIGPYQVEGLLGRGGLGTVYRVLAPDGQPYALKVLEVGAGDPARRLARISREVEALVKIRHPGVVAAYDAGVEGNSIYVLLELVSGGSLEDLLRREGRVAPRRAAELCAELARTLADLHALGVLHRDLKPENVLLSEGRTRLADLGLVHFVDAQERLTRTGATVGTPGYCAPELLSRRGDQQVGPSVDIYGLGATLYALLTGRAPFRGASAYEIAVKTMEERPDRPSDSRGERSALLERLDAICLRCLAKQPQDRYASMALLADELEEVARGQVLPPTEPTSGWAKPALGLSAVGALIVLGVALTRPGPPPSPTSSPTPSASATPSAAASATSSPSPSPEASSETRATPTPSALAPLPGQPIEDISQLLTLGHLARPLWEARREQVELRGLPQGLIGIRAREPAKPCFVTVPRPAGARLRASLQVYVQRGSPLAAGLYYGDPEGQRFVALVVEGGTSIAMLEGSPEGVSRGTHLGGRFGLSTLAIEERAKGLHVTLGTIKMTMGDKVRPEAQVGVFLSGADEGGFSEFELRGLE